MDNRSIILAKALELWSERGYEAVGVQEIVESAGITKPTLYHYFGSKRGLLDALIEEHSAQLQANLGAAAVYDRNLTRTLERIIRCYFDFAGQNPAFYRMLLGFWFAPPGSDENQAVRAGNIGQHDALERLFVAAVPDHGNMRGREKAYAATFLGMINTYAGLALNGFVTLDDRLVHQALHQFQHGIYS
jgi:TetR/AcrR family transcriptional regulator